MRDCDAASSIDGSGYDSTVLRVLDLVLRVADPGQVPVAPHSSTLSSALRYLDPFIGKDKCPAGDSVPFVLDTSFLRPDLYNDKSFKVILKETGTMRKPPNEFDMTLYSSTVGAIKMEEGQGSKVKRVDVPGVPGAFLLTDVLSREECSQIISAAETFGFTADKPSDDTFAASSVSVLAHNFFWLADEIMNNEIFNRYIYIVYIVNMCTL